MSHHSNQLTRQRPEYLRSQGLCSFRSLRTRTWWLPECSGPKKSESRLRLFTNEKNVTLTVNVLIRHRHLTVGIKSNLFSLLTRELCFALRVFRRSKSTTTNLFNWFLSEQRSCDLHLPRCPDIRALRTVHRLPSPTLPHHLRPIALRTWHDPRVISLLNMDCELFRLAQVNTRHHRGQTTLRSD